jgi:hypothetical protein
MIRLLTPAQAAELLAVTPKHLLELTNTGSVRWINIGLDGKRPTRRYAETDIDDFIHTRSQQQCRYTSPKEERTTPIHSKYEVIDFQARREPATAAKPRRSLNS